MQWLEISPHITPVWLFTRPEKERRDMPARATPVRAHSGQSLIAIA
jgi:hypothetical protein